MRRWIAFDQETSSLLRSNLAEDARIEILRRGPVDYALAKPGAVVTLLPGGGPGDIGIAIFRRQRVRPVVQAAAPARREASLSPARSSSTRAAGFLGLSDELATEEEVSQEKKSWWKRFWEE